MALYNKKIADFGENLAVNYLHQQGYEIINRNIKIGYKEVDIIAKIKEKIVFVEVKTRTNDIFSTAEDAFSKNKLNNIKKALEEYFYQYDFDLEKAAIDLITINIDTRKKIANIKHYKSII